MSGALKKAADAVHDRRVQLHHLVLELCCVKRMEVNPSEQHLFQPQLHGVAQQAHGICFGRLSA